MTNTPDITYTMEGPELGSGRRGRLVAHVAGLDGEGEVVWSMSGEDVIVAQFAGVPRHWEGNGVAAKMVTHFFAHARDKGYKVIPQCGYVAALFRRYPEWADLRV